MGISYYTFIFDAYGGESTFPPISVCVCIPASLHSESFLMCCLLLRKCVLIKKNQRRINLRIEKVIVCLTSDSSQVSST